MTKRSLADRTQVVQQIHHKKKTEWEIEAELNQFKRNTKNYFNLTKQSEQQEKAINALEARIQELEKKGGHWKFIAYGVFFLAVAQFIIFLRFIF